MRRSVWPDKSESGVGESILHLSGVYYAPNNEVGAE